MHTTSRVKARLHARADATPGHVVVLDDLLGDVDMVHHTISDVSLDSLIALHSTSRLGLERDGKCRHALALFEISSILVEVVDILRVLLVSILAHIVVPGLLLSNIGEHLSFIGVLLML